MLKTGQVIYLMQLLGQLISLHKKLTTESSLQKKNVDVYTLVKKRTCLNYFAERKNGGGGDFLHISGYIKNIKHTYVYNVLSITSRISSISFIF